MTDLSPQAKAVLDAFDIASDGHYDDGVWVPHIRKQLAAALEAAADQVLPGEVHPQVYEDCCDYASLKTRMGVRTQLLAIAAELRGQDQQKQED